MFCIPTLGGTGSNAKAPDDKSERPARLDVGREGSVETEAERQFFGARVFETPGKECRFRPQKLPTPIVVDRKRETRYKVCEPIRATVAQFVARAHIKQSAFRFPSSPMHDAVRRISSVSVRRPRADARPLIRRRVFAARQQHALYLAQCRFVRRRMRIKNDITRHAARMPLRRLTTRRQTAAGKWEQITPCPWLRRRLRHPSLSTRSLVSWCVRQRHHDVNTPPIPAVGPPPPLFCAHFCRRLQGACHVSRYQAFFLCVRARKEKKNVRRANCRKTQKKKSKEPAGAQ